MRLLLIATIIIIITSCEKDDVYNINVAPVIMDTLSINNSTFEYSYILFGERVLSVKDDITYVSFNIAEVYSDIKYDIGTEYPTFERTDSIVLIRDSTYIY